jgi:uncharacterized SAM-binding protein YcdF (DUF218 family)
MLSWNIGAAIGRIVMPPTIFYLLIALALWQWRKRWAWGLASVSLALLYAFSTPFVAYNLMHLITEAFVPLTPAQIAQLPKQRSMIVVMPAGKRSAPEYPAGETASVLTVERTRYAAWLSRQTGLPLAIPGGNHSRVGLTEAELARSFVEDELKQEVALIETQSLDTRQSALYLSEALRAANVDNVVLVTDARHMARASEAFSVVGFNVFPAPLGFSSRAAALTPSGLIATGNAMAASAAVGHELVGRVWYRIRSLFASVADR